MLIIFALIVLHHCVYFSEIQLENEIEKINKDRYRVIGKKHGRPILS